MSTKKLNINHFDQKRRRKAEFMEPPNPLKQKVGKGGLNEQIITKAQELLENNAVDFTPLAEIYLNSLSAGIKEAHESDALLEKNECEELINKMLYPAVQLKANGGMFRYALVTVIGDRLIQFLEVIDAPDKRALEIVLAFHTTLRAIVMGKIQGDGGEHGRELIDALDDACHRYFIQHPANQEAFKNQNFSEEL